MAIGIETKWPAVPPQVFTANGSTSGIVTVADARGFKVGQFVTIQATGQPIIRLKVKRFISPTEFIVGPEKAPKPGQPAINLRADLSGYTTAAMAFIYAEEQDKASVPPNDIMRSVYEQEPAAAIRTVAVDGFGQIIDSVKGADGKQRMAVDAEVNVEVNSVGLFTIPYDTISVAYPSATQEQYQSYTGGLSGTPVQLVTVNYLDSTKNSITSILRTPEN